MPNGKRKAVEYHDWYSTYEGWNADRVHYPNNPTWGDIYVTTMRSKDDVPYMYRAAAWFPYILEHTEDEGDVDTRRRRSGGYADGSSVRDRATPHAEQVVIELVDVTVVVPGLEVVGPGQQSRFAREVTTGIGAG